MHVDGPFEFGRDAYREQGVPYFNNPYQPDTFEHVKWAEGWLYEQENLAAENWMVVN